MRRVCCGLFCQMTLLLLVVFCAAAGAAQEGGPAALSARFVPDSALVGDRAQLVLSYVLPEGATLPPDPQIQGIDELTLKGLQQKDGEIRVEVLVDQIGTLKTGSLSLGYIDAEGKNAGLNAEPAALTVASNLGERPNEAELKPIYGIMPIRSAFMKQLPWMLMGLGVFAAAGIGLYFWMRRRRLHKKRTSVYVPPHTLAEQEIHELESQRLFEKGRVKEFYFRFSEIMRHYLESLRGFPAAEYTTQEIAQAVQAPEDRRILPLLQDADMVKFADMTPTSAKKEDEIAQALAYIHDTGSTLAQDAEAEAEPSRASRIGRFTKKRSEVTAP